jgi:integrase
MAGGEAMSASVFSSCLAAAMSAFVHWKCCAGIGRRRVESLLGYFDRFLSHERFDASRLDRPITERYLRSMSRLSTATRYHRFGMLRQFAGYLAEQVPDSYVPDPIRSRNEAEIRKAHIYDNGQIAALMRAALRLSPHKPFRAHTYYTLLGLLSCTGMRIAEALALDLDDVHEQGALLHVREGKFSKSRWLPLTACTQHALLRYMAERKQQVARDLQSPLFLNLRGKRLNYNTVYGTFRMLLAEAGLHNAPGPGPRIHDLRHAFAVRRLLQWYRDGEDVNARLPWLATYMGHCHIANTAVYLHATAPLLDQVAERFEQHFELHINTAGL